jgi:glycosyltransferase involved in cell wall biosynthesis
LSRRLRDSRFVIASNGFAEGPAPALRDYLVEKRAGTVTTITHPLLPDDGSDHVVTRWHAGVQVGSRTVKLPSLPPWTYPLDLLVPPWPPAADAWFGFNATACLRGLVARRTGRAHRVVYWCVDYVDERFGTGFLTQVYEWLDGVGCRSADARFELSMAAARARDRRHAGKPLVATRVVPMGSWTQRTPKTDGSAWQRRRLVYLGHLVPRQGVGTMVDAIALLRRRGVSVTAEIIGRGSLETALRQQVRDEGLDDTIRFHGFIADHRQVEAILSECSVALAPYVTDIGSFTEYADPGKVKAYLGAGLPIVLTRVPPIAAEVVANGAGVLVESSPESVAGAVEAMLSSPADWQRHREAALAMAQRYDWETIFSEALESLGFTE